MLSNSLIRLAMWACAAAVSSCPSVLAAQVDITWHLRDMAVEIYKAGFFRDFFFITIVMAVYSLSNSVEYFLHAAVHRPDWIRLIVGVTSAWFIFILVYATSKYGIIAQTQKPGAQTQFDHILQLVWYTMAASAAAELAIGAGFPFRAGSRPAPSRRGQ